MPTHPLGTLIADPIVNGSANVTTGTHFAKLGIGAARQVQTLQERDNILVGSSLNSDNNTSGMREAGMLVYVAESDTEYRLKISDFENLSDSEKLQSLADNNNWVPVSSNVESNFNRTVRHHHVLYVGGTLYGNDATAEVDNRELPYLSLNTASQVARGLYEGDERTSRRITSFLEYRFEAATGVFQLEKGLRNQGLPRATNPDQTLIMGSADYQFIIDSVASNTTLSTLVNPEGNAEFFSGANSTGNYFNIKIRPRTDPPFNQSEFTDLLTGLDSRQGTQELLNRVENAVAGLLLDRFPSLVDGQLVEVSLDTFDVAGTKSLIIVAAGNHPCNNFIKNHVDYYLEEGAILFTGDNATPVISDTAEVLDDVEIKGHGLITHLRTAEEEENHGIYLSRVGSNPKIECMTLDSFNLVLNAGRNFELSNCTILTPQLKFTTGKNITLTNVTFANGAGLPLNGGHLTNIIFESCTFEVPLYRFSDERNTTLDILDFKGDLFERIQIFGNDFPENLPSLNINAVRNRSFSRTVAGTGIPTGLAGFTYAQTASNGVIGDIRVKVLNCTINIRRGNGIGVYLMRLADNTFGSAGHIVIQNLKIEDFVRFQGAAITTGWGEAATNQPELHINSIIHNCINGNLGLPNNAPLNPWVNLGWSELS